MNPLLWAVLTRQCLKTHAYRDHPFRSTRGQFRTHPHWLRQPNSTIQRFQVPTHCRRLIHPLVQSVTLGKHVRILWRTGQHVMAYLTPSPPIKGDNLSRISYMLLCRLSGSNKQERLSTTHNPTVWSSDFTEYSTTRWPCNELPNYPSCASHFAKTPSDLVYGTSMRLLGKYFQSTSSKPRLFELVVVLHDVTSQLRYTRGINYNAHHIYRPQSSQ